MSWRVARSLNVLLDELDTVAPLRSTVSDGSIGDAAHASRDSDHNPWVIDRDGVGVVRARDVTHDPGGGLDCHRLAAGLVELLNVHPAMTGGAYVIWNGRICSANRRAEGWRPYSGSNPHTKHLHVSVALNSLGYDNTRPWHVLEDDMALSADDKQWLIGLIDEKLEVFAAGDLYAGNPDKKVTRDEAWRRAASAKLVKDLHRGQAES